MSLKVEIRSKLNHRLLSVAAYNGINQVLLFQYPEV